MSGSRYVITDLNPPFGPQQPAQGSSASALNDLGQVTLIGSRHEGGPSGPDVSGAFLYSNGTYTALPLFNPTAINNKGQILDYNGLFQNGVLSSIPVLLPTNISSSDSPSGRVIPAGINEQGQVVGTSSVQSEQNGASPTFQVFTHAVLYQNGQTTNLDIVSPSAGGAGANAASSAAAINNSGQVVGAFGSGGTLPSGGLQGHAFVYSNGVTTDLGTLGGSNSGAIAINNNGQIVGYAELAGSTPTTLVDRFGNTVPGPPLIATHAVLWQNGAAVDLSAPNDGNASAINDQGQIVGSYTTSKGDSRAFVYRSGKLADLNTLLVNGGWTIRTATGINSKGQICGTGIYKGLYHAVLLTPQ